MYVDSTMKEENITISGTKMKNTIKDTCNINTDVKLTVNGEWNMRVIYQNNKEDVEAEVTCNQQGYHNPMVAEAQTVINSLTMATMMGKRKVKVNKDFPRLVERVKGSIGNNDKTHMGYQIQNIEKILDSFEMRDIKFISLTDNQRAQLVVQLVIIIKTNLKLLKPKSNVIHAFLSLFLINVVKCLCQKENNTNIKILFYIDYDFRIRIVRIIRI